AQTVMDLPRGGVGLHDLDRDLAVEGEVAGEVNRAHAAPSQQPHQAVLRLQLRLQRRPQRVALGRRLQRHGNTTTWAEAGVVVEPALAGVTTQGRRFGLQALVQQANGAQSAGSLGLDRGATAGAGVRFHRSLLPSSQANPPKGYRPSGGGPNVLRRWRI